LFFSFHLNNTQTFPPFPALPEGKFLPTRRTPGVSTSELLERIVAGYRKREFDAKLEKIGARELKAEGSDFDDSPQGSRATSRSRAWKVGGAGGGGLLGVGGAPPPSSSSLSSPGADVEDDAMDTAQ
jgi:hypothetical protein